MKRQAMTVSVGLLRKRHACWEQIQLFRDTFGDSATLTKANWNKAQSAGLDVLWLICLLSPSARAEYDKAVAPAQAEYSKTVAPARAKYDKAVTSALSKYDKAVTSALAEYNKAATSALAEYNKAVASARAKYNKAVASALYDVLRAEV